MDSLVRWSRRLVSVAFGTGVFVATCRDFALPWAAALAVGVLGGLGCEALFRIISE